MSLWQKNNPPSPAPYSFSGFQWFFVTFLESKVHGANMGPIWDRQDPGGPHVGPMNLTIWVDGLDDVIPNNCRDLSKSRDFSRVHA